MPSYPASLPPPEIPSYELQSQENVGRTEMDAGPARQRRRFRSVPTRIPISWLYNRTEFAIFEGWHKHTLSDGAAWFDVTLANGLELQEVEARFTRQPRKKILGGLNWRVTAELEVREMPTLSAEETELALAYADIPYTSAALHELLHVTLPSPGYW